MFEMPARDPRPSFFSYSHFYANPFYLRTVSKLMGVPAAPLGEARILELGCASGANILPFSCQFPHSYSMGIDSSMELIAKGNEWKQARKQSNIDLICCDFLDIDDSFGKFDYIIVHDVFSRVSEEVRNKIYTVCKENLHDNGLAYISYQALPGWNNLATVRDLALFHSKNFIEFPEKINQIKLLFDFVKDAVKSSESAYAKQMRETAGMLNGKPDFMIAHDFLQPMNKAFYFCEFIEGAAKYGLQYLADAELPKMYLPNYSPLIRDKLGKVEEVVRMEQYLDFLTNRAYRQSILCHNHHVVNRTFSMDLLSDFYVKMNLYPREIADAPEEEHAELTFYLNNQPEDFLKTKEPKLKAIFKTLSEHGEYLFFKDLISLAKNKLPEVSSSELETQAKVSLTDLFLKGKLDVRADLIPVNTCDPRIPKAWDYAVAQTLYLKQEIVTNLYFESVSLSLFEFYLIRYLDGKNTQEEIGAKMLEHFRNGDLVTHYKGSKVTSPEKWKSIISLAYIDAIEKFQLQALLV
jgi:methyltransferase-like protein